jgi:hypothetical protein
MQLLELVTGIGRYLSVHCHQKKYSGKEYRPSSHHLIINYTQYTLIVVYVNPLDEKIIKKVVYVN